MMEQHTLVSRLIRWANWRMKSGVALGYPKKVSFVRLASGSSQSASYEDIDSECIETNEVYELLPEIPKAVIHMEYITDGSSSESVKAYKSGVCIRSYRNYKRDAYQFMLNIFNSKYS